MCILFMGSYVEAAEPQAKSKQKQNKIYKSEIEADGYTYIYEAVPIPNTEAKYGEIFYTGRIIIRGADKDTIYQENTGYLQPEKCDNFPTDPKLPVKYDKKEKWLVILCGSSSGRHQTLKVFFQHPISGLRAISLEFGDTTPTLSDIDGDGIYEAKVYRRIHFPEARSGLQNYLMVYKLHIDETLFGFIPVFGPEMAKPYLDYYIWQKESLNRKIKDKRLSNEDKKILFDANAGQILSALIATQDKNKICAEIKELDNFGLTASDVQAWEKRLKGLGFPSFDLTICKENLK